MATALQRGSDFAQRNLEFEQIEGIGVSPSVCVLPGGSGVAEKGSGNHLPEACKCVPPKTCVIIAKLRIFSWREAYIVHLVSSTS